MLISSYLSVQATYPLLLVKTRLMSASKDTHAHMKYSGPVDAVLRILKDEGAALRIRSLDAAPVSAIISNARMSSPRGVSVCSPSRFSSEVLDSCSNRRGCIRRYSWLL